MMRGGIKWFYNKNISNLKMFTITSNNQLLNDHKPLSCEQLMMRILNL